MSQTTEQILDRLHDSRSTRGATITEYALLLVFVLLVAIFGVRLFGTTLTVLFSKLSSALATASDATSR